MTIAAIVGAVMIIQRAPEASDGNPAGAAPQGPPPAAVFSSPVETAKAQHYAKVTGSLRPALRSELAAQEMGAVDEILVDEGQEVTAGTVLLRLDGRRIKAQLEEAQARLGALEQRIEQREAELERARKDKAMKRALLEAEAIAESDLLDAERTLLVSQALLAAAEEEKSEAKSRIELLEIRQKDLVLEAPYAGLITERLIEPGEWAGAGEHLLTLVSTDPVEAWLNVPERYLIDIKDNPEAVRVLI